MMLCGFIPTISNRSIIDNIEYIDILDIINIIKTIIVIGGFLALKILSKLAAFAVNCLH